MYALHTKDHFDDNYHLKRKGKKVSIIWQIQSMRNTVWKVWKLQHDESWQGLGGVMKSIRSAAVDKTMWDIEMRQLAGKANRGGGWREEDEEDEEEEEED